MALAAAVNELAALYRQSDEETRRCIIDGGLEHLFEEPGARALFEHWRSDKELSVAYREAAEWADDHPKRPS